IAEANAYPCACTRREITADAARGINGMIYPGTCRDGLPAGRNARSWRFRCTHAPVQFFDRAHGNITIDLLTTQGDFLVRRGDGLHAYHLAMVLDDAALGVTHVVRGEDLLYATAPQVALQRALKLPTPQYWHTPIALNAGGRKLSKTNNAPAVDPANPTPHLIQALEFLRLSPPQELATAPPPEILDWASRHWATHVIRSVTTGERSAHEQT
ncbi:MAG: tRNA glutamyl-Q(34) synthetase GluQRS, partial [Gammaproteobacteria bacterium]|nr:tRNA glutamyl-Q(34) synthetase GluQRS [Gammaproteobacteria bacterium]